MKYYIKKIFFVVIIFILNVTNVYALLDVRTTAFANFVIYPGEAIVNHNIAEFHLIADEPYQVRLISANNGRLLYIQDEIPYTISYDNSTQISLTTTPIVVEQGSRVSGTGVRSLAISIAGNVSMGIPAGPYQDTVTIEILAP